MHRWTGGDAASVGLSVSRSKASSVVSSYARTVVGSQSGHSQTPDNHQLFCNGCSNVSSNSICFHTCPSRFVQPIIGVRYQCGNCSSLPRAYNLVRRFLQVSLKAARSPSVQLVFKLRNSLIQPTRCNACIFQASPTGSATNRVQTPPSTCAVCHTYTYPTL